VPAYAGDVHTHHTHRQGTSQITRDNRIGGTSTYLWTRATATHITHINSRIGATSTDLWTKGRTDVQQDNLALKENLGERYG